jgi:hypothetical protein
VRESGHRLLSTISVGLLIAVVISVAAWTAAGGPASGSEGLAAPAARVSIGRHGATYQALAGKSVRLLEKSFYNGSGLWHMCLPKDVCNTKNRDWGSDALTNALYFRWMLTRDQTVLPVARRLALTARDWTTGERASSDNVAWDAVAEVRLYQMTGSKIALAKAETALRWVDTEKGLDGGACPTIGFQWPFGANGGLKTIETNTNYIKAALLLYEVTGRHKYLTHARAQYALVRRYFLAHTVPLYSAYMFDNGSTCQVLPGRFFASVNGNMIWAGQSLAAVTGKPGYLRQAIATARAVSEHLSDGAGVFADLQADNDLVGPLVEAMYSLATRQNLALARHWLMVNASAAGADENPAGEFGRFFDGPPPTELATAWQVSGGIFLVQAAAALDPAGQPADPKFWQRATLVPDSKSLPGNAKAASDQASVRGKVRIAFTGRAIAIMGTIGADCCIAGHARVLVDGVETVNQAGIWQDFSSPSRRQYNQVLFAWRWRTSGHHVITILPGLYDHEEGGSFFQMTGYQLVK